MFKSKNQKGFSLLETIIAIAILAVIGAFSTDILLKSFQGGEKSQTISMIKQNGQSALGIMDRTIRSANSFICSREYPETDPNIPPTKTLVLYTNESYIRFVIKPGTTNNNGYIAKDLLTVSSSYSPASISDGTNGACVIDADTVNTPPIFTVSNRVYLTNTETASGVSVKEGNFTITSSSGRTQADVVKVYFKLGPPFSAAFSNSTSNSEEFTTTVKLFEK